MPRIMPKKRIGIVQSIKNKIIGGASSVLALPATIKSNKVQKQANYDFKILKADRANREAGYSYNPNEGDYRDPKFRTAVDAIGVRSRLERKVN